MIVGNSSTIFWLAVTVTLENKQHDLFLTNILRYESDVFLGLLTLKDETYRMFRNVAKQLPTYTACTYRKSEYLKNRLLVPQ